ncbi:Endo-1,4-beta-xylanase A precursor [Pelotomaculum sp. FP]|uniref:S-layer homology domain-containing protein n=1 Tax=Pelotomaculum sp. FP TaxID=261474 RepID=UPI001066B668|nr:S-layer homology domain-containing protein [Pelotomaculum sp. FP]TEB16747.1 Endo-1,4-beta-xylanase A precursor [Pelotomaculum sp. FP]
MQKCSKALALFLAAWIMLGCSVAALAAETVKPPVSLEKAIADTGAYLLKTVPDPQVGSIGGEWAVIGLARAGYKAPPNWYEAYYKTLEAEVVKRQGVLHDKKYTEYSRVVLALTAIGKNPADVGGYNLLAKLGDYNKVLWQGINGPIFALLALDAGDYAVPAGGDAQVQTTRELLLDTIVKRQLPDGGFSLGGETGDPDLTAMALQALAPYQERADIKAVIDKARNCLSNLQNSDGGFASWGAANSESVVQALVALTALGIDPDTDSRFIKNGNSLMDNLLTFYVPGGGFKHIADDAGPNGMATEQGFYGLIAYKRFKNGENSLYDMSDAKGPAAGQNPGTAARSEKAPGVKAGPVIYPNKAFADTAGNDSREAIEALASRGIINGVSDAAFEPDRTMTRAEFAAIVVRALGLPPANDAVFTDVAATNWYAPYVGTAYARGIVNGTSETVFSPASTIAREEAAAMVARAAKLCGMDTGMTDAETRDMLAQFPDYTTSSTWARESLAFCYKEGILSQEALNIVPQEAVTRAEIAGMVYRMLQKAELL